MPDFLIERDSGIERLSLADDEILVGRGEEADLRIDDESVSRRHCRILRQGSLWLLEDLGSGNGTWQDGRRIRRVSIERGAVFEVGDARVTFLGAVDIRAEAPDPDSTSSGLPSAPEAPVAAAVPGIEIGALEGEDLLGRIHAARESATGRPVTIRVLHRSWLEAPGFRGWLDEALEDWKGVVEIGGVPTRCVETEDGGLALVEDRLGGEWLAERISRERRLGQEESARILSDLVALTSELHDRGKRLRGLRPERVLLRGEGGVALAFYALPEAHLERARDGEAGELAALAPEVFTEDGVPGRRTDVYALGALAHAMLLGAPAAEGRTFEIVRRQALRGLYKTPEERRADLVEGFGELVTACLAQDPEDRPGDLGEIRRRLEEIAVRAGARRARAPAAVQGREREIGERPAAPKKSLRYRLMSLGITGAIMVVLNGGVYLLFTGKLVNILPGCSETETKDGSPQGVPSEVDEGPPTVTDEDVLARLLSEDRFDEAWSQVLAARREGRLDAEGERVGLERVRRRKEARLVEIADGIEQAAGRGDAEEARRGLKAYEGIAGSLDSEFRRLSALVAKLVEDG